MAGVNINQGTQTNIATDAIGTVNYQIVKLDRGAAGASSLFTGTVDAVTNLAGGTVSSVANLVKGTITRVEGGTLNSVGGTVITDNFTFRHGDAFATVINVGTSVFGTIKPAVSGSCIYVTDLVVSVGTASNVVIASGGTSTPILGTLHLSTNGGAVMNFKTPIATASGSALVYKQSADGPLTITALGYVD